MEKKIFTIDRLSLKGDGVGHLKNDTGERGKVAFLPYTLPGEEVSARPLFEKKDYSRHIPVRILKPSRLRRQAPCPFYFNPEKASVWCGGCDFQHLDHEAQVSAKGMLVQETLERIGGIKNPPMRKTLHASGEFRYRNKVQVPVGGGVNNIQTGFFQPDSHTLVPFDDCLVQPEVMVRVLGVIRQLASVLKWVPYDEDHHRGWLRHILLRTNKKGNVLAALITKDSTSPEREMFSSQLREKCPEVTAIYQNVQPRQTHVILGDHWTKWWGADGLLESIGGLSIGYSPGSFFQINTDAAEILYQTALTELDLKGNESVLDLYCGVGALTLLLAKRIRFVWGVEVAPSSIRDARRNAELNQIKNVQFIQSDAEHFFDSDEFDSLERRAGSLSVVVDPPRAGLDARVVRQLMELNPMKLIYISCDPATLARDLKIFSSQYDIGSVTPVDLFPQTSHIEVVTRLESKKK